MRQKLILSLVFSLVFFTIAITIVRGSVFHDEYSGNGKIQSATFTWFWFYCGFSVGMFHPCSEICVLLRMVAADASKRFSSHALSLSEPCSSSTKANVVLDFKSRSGLKPLTRATSVRAGATGSVNVTTTRSTRSRHLKGLRNAVQSLFAIWRPSRRVSSRLIPITTATGPGLQAKTSLSF